MKLGFTGTQQGMTDIQKKLVSIQIEECTEFHHGDCIGADAEAANLASLLNKHIVSHPPIKDYRRARTMANEIRQAKDYLIRNHDIVNETHKLLAAPKEKKEVLRSGTWATIRYAKKIGRTIIIVYPDGECQAIYPNSVFAEQTP